MNLKWQTHITSSMIRRYEKEAMDSHELTDKNVGGGTVKQRPGKKTI